MKVVIKVMDNDGTERVAFLTYNPWKALSFIFRHCFN